MVTVYAGAQLCDICCSFRPGTHEFKY